MAGLRAVSVTVLYSILAGWFVACVLILILGHGWAKVRRDLPEPFDAADAPNADVVSLAGHRAVKPRKGAS